MRGVFGQTLGQTTNWHSLELGWPLESLFRLMLEFNGPAHQTRTSSGTRRVGASELATGSEREWKWASELRAALSARAPFKVGLTELGLFAWSVARSLIFRSISSKSIGAAKLFAANVTPSR